MMKMNSSSESGRKDCWNSQDIQAFSGQDWISKGEAAFSGGNLDEAWKCFEKALQWRPFDATVHNNLSMVYWQMGNAEEALHSLTRALELDRDDQDVILNCGKVFRNLGKADEAREILESYLARKPWDREVRQELDELITPATEKPESDAADFFNSQGEEQFTKGNMDHARACFEMAIEHDPKLAKAHSNLGVVYWQEGDLEKALTYLYEALELDSEDPDILYNSSRALASAGEWNTSADLLKIYLQKNPSDENAWQEYRSLIEQIGASGWKSVGLSSNAAEVYVRMGKELAAADDRLGAAEAFHRAIRLNGHRVEPYYQLGCLHRDLGQETEALEMIREGLALDSAHKPSVLAVGEILVSEGRMDEARELYETYLAAGSDADIEAALERALHGISGTL